MKKNFHKQKKNKAIIIYKIIFIFCAAFLHLSLAVNESTNPSASVFAKKPSCTNGTPNSDGSLEITTVTDGDRVNFSIGNSYTGDTDYANAIPIGTLPFQFANGLSNPSGSQDYTVRIFNGAGDLFSDFVVTLNAQTCPSACNCTEYIYLNEPTSSGVHKFAVNPDGSLTERDNGAGGAWYSGNQLPEPHGLGVDLNGFLYIGEKGGFDDIRKLTCDGEIFPEGNNPGEFSYLSNGQYNIGSLGNTLYFNNNNRTSDNQDIRALDICTQTITGAVQFCEADAFYDWGFFVDRRTGKMYATHSASKDTAAASYLWIFEESDFDNNPNTCVNAVSLSTPLPEGVDVKIRGVATDIEENIYIAIDGNRTGDNYILKYGPGPNYPFLAQSPIDNTEDGVGYTRIIGLIYSETSNRIYASTQSKIDDCVSLFDTDLNYLGAAVPPTGTGDNGKGIALLKECCPINNTLTIDTALCSNAINSQLFLQDLVNCGDGVICEGQWTEAAGNTGLTFNPCDLSITIASAAACGTFTLASDGTGNNPQCSAFTIEVNITVNTLDLTVNQISCVENIDRTFTANYEVMVDWNSIQCTPGDVINVTHNGNSIGMIDPSTDTSPSTFPFMVTADGNGTELVKAVYTIAGCEEIISFKAPPPCPNEVATCASTSGCIGGNIFEDFNCNGTEDTNEPGVQGINIQVYDCNNTLVGTGYSDADGDWQICGLTDGTAYRTEFVLPESISCWARPTHVAGGGNQSDIQFLTAPACTQFSVSSPADYCQTNPQMAVACYENGTGDGNNNAGLVSFTYSASGLPTGYKTSETSPTMPGTAQIPQKDATIDEVGAVYGTAWQAKQQRLFLAALTKRYVGFNDGPGYIYAVDYSSGAAATPVGFNLQGVNPANGGTAIDLGAVCRDATCANDVGNTGIAADYTLPASPTAQSIDLDAFAKVGGAAYGDADMSEDGNTLFLVNLFQKAIITIDASGTMGSLPGTINQYLLSNLSGIPTCENGVFRPWALAFEKGRGYLGGVCDASISQDSSDLQAYILSFDPNNISNGFVTEVSFGLDYNREIGQSGPAPSNLYWQPWARNWSELDTFTNGGDNNLMAPQPILSDIVFNEKGDMTIGIMDRFGHQNGRANKIAVSQTTDAFDTNSGGDIVQICRANNSWALEGSINCPVNDNNPEGDPLRQLLQNDGLTNNGEFFYEDYFTEDSTNTSNFTHAETATGGLALLKGTGEVVSTHYDPLWGPPRIVNAQGIAFHNTYTGAKTDAYQVVESTGNDPNTFAKANGLGDLENRCDPAPLEIGNYVWCDSLENGIQDACERGINHILVQLYDRNGVLVGQDTTSNAGQYYFNQNNVDTTGITINGSGTATPNSGNFTGMSYTTQYFIVFGGGQFSTDKFTIGSATYGITSMVNTGSNDNIDSDVDGSSLTTGSLGTRPNGLPFIGMTTSATGCGDHKYDLGVTCNNCFTIDSLITNRVICSGDLVDTLAITTTFSNPDSIAFVYFANQQTDASIIYTDGTGIDTIQISASKDTVLITNINIAAFTNTGLIPDTFYVYAIKMPIPSAATCRPYEELLVIVHPCDWGDLPDPSTSPNVSDYQTLRNNMGPVHVITTGLYLGATVDGEANGQPTNNALGDGADEDGLTISANLDISPSSIFRLPLNYTNTTGNTAHIEAWIDWNGNGQFEDAGEMVFDGMDAGSNAYDKIEVTIPNGALINHFLGLRIRISHADNMTPYGRAHSGEVEDYLIALDCPTPICLPIKAVFQKE